MSFFVTRLLWDRLAEVASPSERFRRFLPGTMLVAALADVWAWEAFLVVMPEVGGDFFADFFGCQWPILPDNFSLFVARGT